MCITAVVSRRETEIQSFHSLLKDTRIVRVTPLLRDPDTEEVTRLYAVTFGVVKTRLD